MKTIFGYARVSTKQQSLERQVSNIRRRFPDAVFFTENFTGREVETRPEFSKLMKTVKPGDTIVFDEVSRMARNAAEGFAAYKQLFEMGVDLIFLKESHVNTEVFRQKQAAQIENLASTGSAATDTLLKTIVDALNKYALDIVEEQIKLAFVGAEDEIKFNSTRTKEGMISHGATNKTTADGQVIEYGSIAKSKLGKTYETAKARECKAAILKHSKSFGGDLDDSEMAKLAGCSRNMLYRYKRELKAAGQD